MSVIQNNLLLTGEDGAFQVSKSLRLRSSANATLTRTPSSTGNRKTWTYSAWIKKSTNDAGTVGLFNCFPTSGSVNDSFRFIFQDDFFRVWNYSGASANTLLTWSGKRRDISAWYHVVLSVDTTQATNTNRIRLYVNGQLLTSLFDITYPSQNTDLNINTTNLHTIGNERGYSNYFDGYLTQITFVDGQALDASSFGVTNAQTGAWEAKKYSGSYGTNGFYLPMNKTEDGFAVDYLIVAGGGGGGGAYAGGGGGGAGGMLSGTSIFKSGTTYTVTVGAGGTGGNFASGTSGQNSSVAGLTSIGGGFGSFAENGGNGGSGGGGSGFASARLGGSGTAGQGNNGGSNSLANDYGAGGGGAGAVGQSVTTTVGGNGGNGLASSITGSSVTYAGGGGGGAYAGTAGTGGSGGGGNGGVNANASAGTANRGGGGGGAGGDPTARIGGNGGSGVVILRILTSQYTGTTTGSPTVTTSGSFTVLTYNSSGSYTA